MNKSTLMVPVLLVGCPAVKAPQVSSTAEVPQERAEQVGPDSSDVVAASGGGTSAIDPDQLDRLAGAVEAPPVAIKAHTGVVLLMPFAANTFTVEVGSRVEYGFAVHPSVGEESIASSSDDKVLPLVSQDAEYDRPKDVKSGMTGADAMTGTYVWVAKAPGEVRIWVRESYRGEVKNTYEFDVTVVPKSK